jgi:hypothetical protein
MTDTKPTLPELIDYQQRKLQDNPPNPVVTLINSTILDSLKELQNIKSQPVEPDEVTLLKMRVDYWENEAKRYAVNAEYWRERAEKAEASNKRLLELLKALLGALKHPVSPTQKQWDAIGVVSNNILRVIKECK